jgi:hypothetical protein
LVLQAAAVQSSLLAETLETPKKYQGMSLLETLSLNLLMCFLVAPLFFHHLTFVFPLAESYYNSTTCLKVLYDFKAIR